MTIPRAMGRHWRVSDMRSADRAWVSERLDRCIGQQINAMNQRIQSTHVKINTGQKRFRGPHMTHCLTPPNGQIAQGSKGNPNTKIRTEELTIYKISPYQTSLPIPAVVHFTLTPSVSQRPAATSIIKQHSATHLQSESVSLPKSRPLWSHWKWWELLPTTGKATHKSGGLRGTLIRKEHQRT